jgi:hypothetical protein
MTIQEALLLGNDCGLQTVREAIINVEIHYSSLFIIDNLDKELQELYDTWEKFKSEKKLPFEVPENAQITEDTSIRDILYYGLVEDC